MNRSPKSIMLPACLYLLVEMIIGMLPELGLSSKLDGLG